MPATTQKAHDTTYEPTTEEPVWADRTNPRALAGLTPAADPACECDECQGVVRDEMWTRWA